MNLLQFQWFCGLRPDWKAIVSLEVVGRALKVSESVRKVGWVIVFYIRSA
jgi:hypothetical protein